MGPTWGPSVADRTQVGPMLAPWILLSGITGSGCTKNFSFKIYILWKIISVIIWIYVFDHNKSFDWAVLTNQCCMCNASGYSSLLEDWQVCKWLQQHYIWHKPWQLFSENRCNKFLFWWSGIKSKQNVVSMKSEMQESLVKCDLGLQLRLHIHSITVVASELIMLNYMEEVEMYICTSMKWLR